MDEKIVTAMTAAQPLNWAKAQELANQFDVKPRAIVASAVRLGLDYTRKERVSKSGEKVIGKADLVAQIAGKLGTEVEALSGLEKANKSALTALRLALS